MSNILSFALATSTANDEKLLFTFVHAGFTPRGSAGLRGRGFQDPELANTEWRSPSPRGRHTRTGPGEKERLLRRRGPERASLSW